MVKIIKTFFVVLGVIFFVLLVIVISFFIKDPYNLRPMLVPVISEMIFPNSSSRINKDDGLRTSSNNHPEDTNLLEVSGSGSLTSDQADALKANGVDPNSLPTTITPEQEECFVKIFGQTRVNEIKAGGTPTATEFIKGTSCL